METSERLDAIKQELIKQGVLADTEAITEEVLEEVDKKLEDIDLTDYVKKTDVETDFDINSNNPIANSFVTREILNLQSQSHPVDMQDSPDVSDIFGNDLRDNPNGYSAVYSPSYKSGIGTGFIDGKPVIRWNTGNNTFTYTLGGGGGGDTTIEVWKGNVGFGEQDTFFAAKKTADGDGQFQNGYPRLHNHGQDIHEVSGFSRDSREDEDVWSHRLLLPWDLAKANDTSYLMAGVVWDGSRNLFVDGDTATFVQPLLPTNNGSTKSYLPYAVPCFENSPVFWKGTIIWNDGTQTISKAVQIPWDRVQQDMRGPDELALKKDIDAIVGNINSILETI